MSPATTEEADRGGRLRLPRWARSARTRLALSMLALLAVCSFVSVLALRQILISRTGDRVDRSLEQEVSEFQRLAALGRDPRTGRPFGNDVKSVFEVFLARNVPAVGEAFFTFIDSVPFRSSSNRAPDQGLVEEIASLGPVRSSTRGELEAGGDDIRYLAVPIVTEGRSQGAFVVTIDVGGERAEVNEAVRIAAGVSIVVFLIAALIVFAMVGRVLSPVRALTDTARSISESDLTRRIEVEGDDELGQLARTFNGMLDRLEAAFASQRRFLSDAGHELRTPITIVRGHLEVMGEDPDERRETIALVTDELDRMGRLVDELLLLERTQRPGFLRDEPVSLDELTSETLAKASAIAPRDWQLEGARRGEVVADRQRLQQALLNLAENAAKYTSERDRIRIGAEIRNGSAELWVGDTGPGIDPAEQGRLFERFHRGERGRAGDEGTGLGLAVVKAIAEAHGGRVELVSSLGAGATFTLVLPAERGERAAVNRILIAEDEPRLSSFLEKGLAAAGYVTAVVDDGGAASLMARDEDFDLLILDIGLPGKDGFAVLREVRAAAQRMPVIILTARDELEDKVGGLEGGADDYVTKPFRFEELLARVRARLREDTRQGASPVIRAGRIALDPRTRRVVVDGRDMELSAREYSMLEVLMRHPNQVMSREQLLSQVWGYDFDPGSNVIDVYVGYLRRKLGAQSIETVRGAGYLLRTDEEASD